MFQYEFFSKKDFVRHSAPKESLPDCFTTLKDIRWVRSSYWAEHCLECGEPLCYETCPNFVARADQRCRLFKYGMYDNPHFKNSPYHVELQFRKWGKMETILYPGSLSPDEAMQLHDNWKQQSLEKNALMRFGKLGLRRFPIEERRKFDSQKYGVSTREGADNPQDTFHFLLQLYSYEKEPFVLFFDITDDTDLSFRESITIFPGYNQKCMDVQRIFPPKGRLRAKFYPADNAESDVVFLFCEFVQLMPNVHPQTYPVPAIDNQQLQPADKIKCIAWDLDCTLWDGILIESNPDNLSLNPTVLDTVKALDQRGIIQIVVSKNTEADVLPVLKRLNIYDYFVYIFANWDAKSANIKHAAELLNIGINTFALVDDSIFERNEVTYELPMVRVYPETVLNADSAEYLLTKPELDVPVTEDSKNRRQMYQIEAHRKQAALGTNGNNLAFLKSCNIIATISKPTTSEEYLRSYELLQRTNQLNLSGNKYQQDDFFAHVKSAKTDCYIIKCEDRFGSYGQVAYLEAIPNSLTNTLQITEFAMSCRVANKYVEASLIKELFAHYAPQNISQISLCGTKTSRNNLLIQTFTAMGFEQLDDTEKIHLSCSFPEDLLNTGIVTTVMTK